jgi:hypothetical protein
MSQQIHHQITLTEALKNFLTGLQNRLLETIDMYDKSLQAIEGEQFSELVERQRNEYFARTKKEIEDLIEIINRSDKPLADQILRFLDDLLKTKT